MASAQDSRVTGAFVSAAAAIRAAFTSDRTTDPTRPSRLPMVMRAVAALFSNRHTRRLVHHTAATPLTTDAPPHTPHHTTHHTTPHHTHHHTKPQPRTQNPPPSPHPHPPQHSDNERCGHKIKRRLFDTRGGLRKGEHRMASGPQARGQVAQVATLVSVDAADLRPGVAISSLEGWRAQSQPRISRCWYRSQFFL